MARGFKRFDEAFTCQASSAITADAFSAGTQTDYDSTASGNADGTFEVEIEIDVTAWTADAKCEIYDEALQHDAVGYSAPRLIGSVAITAADKYIARIPNVSEKGKILLKAITTGFTASASMRGIYPADV